ncbi:hypothetical protein [Bacillus atrophaeus]|uniref:hypothetical protein n=1 Tax=Bacillus atrophaeus TaxID=1452 RepID=UPI002E244F7A|nr:hypothetical protein [Bacillus atrophaeus]MED1032520.1 hypothetical protein [Bacillus atrophaeus]MED1121034.1 hypothetical protein [Bacillus atrophaeus]
MTLEQYIKLRNKGYDLPEIERDYVLSEGTVWNLELGYTCYLKRIPLDQAVAAISSIETNQIH